MSPGHVLRACSLAASTILRHTSKFRRWEAKWKKQVTGSMPWRLHLGSSPFVSLCFPSTKRWAASATWSCSHDPGWWTEISDTVSSNKTPPTPTVVFTYSVRALTSWRTFSPSSAEPMEIAQVMLSASDDNITRLGSKTEEGVLWLQHPFPHPSPHLFMYYMGLNQIPRYLSLCSTFFFLIFSQETLKYISVLGGNGYRWCPWPMGRGDHLVVLLPIVSKHSTKGGLAWNLAAHFHLWLYHFHPYAPGKSLLLTSPLYTHFKDKDNYTQVSQRI